MERFVEEFLALLLNISYCECLILEGFDQRKLRDREP